MTEQSQRRHLLTLRRQFHKYPEPSWCEYWTTGTIVEELERLGADEIHVGPEVLDPAARMHLPAEKTQETWRRRAEDRGISRELLDRMGGSPGCIGVLRRGDGPHVALRVDIDALPIKEATDRSHNPAEKGFRSQNDGYMHACGHDGHITIGLGVFKAIAESDFSGTLTVFFQPAEEVLGGGKATARSSYLNGVDALFGIHLGLNHNTGEVVAGIEKPLSVKELQATMHGESAHAGIAPNEGDNAIQAMATAVQSLYGIPRHGEGLTRVNVGTVDAGDAINIIAENAAMDIEIRGGTNNLAEYMYDEVQRRLQSSAEMHGCDVDIELLSEAPRADSDPSLRQHVQQIAADAVGVNEAIPAVEFGASEDATYLMNAVSENGGESTYLVVGTDYPSGHHTSRFDIDESSLEIGVDILSRAILDY